MHLLSLLSREPGQTRHHSFVYQGGGDCDRDDQCTDGLICSPKRWKIVWSEVRQRKRLTNQRSKFLPKLNSTSAVVQSGVQWGGCGMRMMTAVSEGMIDKSLHRGFLASSLSCSVQTPTHSPHPPIQSVSMHLSWFLWLLSRSPQSHWLKAEEETKPAINWNIDQGGPHPIHLYLFWRDFDSKINPIPRCTSEHPCTHGEGHCTADSECERNGYHVCGASCIGG